MMQRQFCMRAVAQAEWGLVQKLDISRTQPMFIIHQEKIKSILQGVMGSTIGVRTHQTASLGI